MRTRDTRTGKRLSVSHKLKSSETFLFLFIITNVVLHFKCLIFNWWKSFQVFFSSFLFRCQVFRSRLNFPVPNNSSKCRSFFFLLLLLLLFLFRCQLTKRSNNCTDTRYRLVGRSFDDDWNDTERNDRTTRQKQRDCATSTQHLLSRFSSPFFVRNFSSKHSRFNTRRKREREREREEAKLHYIVVDDVSFALQHPYGIYCHFYPMIYMISFDCHLLRTFVSNEHAISSVRYCFDDLTYELLSWFHVQFFFSRLHFRSRWLIDILQFPLHRTKSFFFIFSFFLFDYYFWFASMFL